MPAGKYNTGLGLFLKKGKFPLSLGNPSLHLLTNSLLSLTILDILNCVVWDCHCLFCLRNLREFRGAVDGNEASKPLIALLFHGVSRVGKAESRSPQKNEKSTPDPVHGVP